MTSALNLSSSDSLSLIPLQNVVDGAVVTSGIRHLAEQETHSAGRVQAGASSGFMGRTWSWLKGWFGGATVAKAQQPSQRALLAASMQLQSSPSPLRAAPSRGSYPSKAWDWIRGARAHPSVSSVTGGVGALGDIVIAQPLKPSRPLLSRAWSWIKGCIPGGGTDANSKGGVKGVSWPSYVLDLGIRVGLYNPRNQAEIERWRADHFAQSSVRGNTAHTVARFVRDLIRHELKYPAPHNNDNPSWTAHIGLAGREQSTFGKTIKWLAENQAAFLQDSLDALVAKAFANMSNRIHSKTVDVQAAPYEKDFMLDGVTSILKRANNHFRRINSTREEKGKNVTDAILCAQFGSELHPAISPEDGDLPEYMRHGQRVETFFRPFAARLLAISFPKGAADLPVPRGSRGILWEQLSRNILPDALEGIFKQILDPRVVNKILLNVLQTMNAPGECRELDAAPYEHDPKQRELEGVCAELTKSLGLSLSPTMTKLILSVPGAQARFGEALALQVRERLKEWPLDRIINEGCFNGLPNWLPGHWEDKKGQLVAEFRPGFDLTFIPDGRGDFQFPRSAEEGHFQDLGQKSEDRQTVTKIHEELNYLIKKSVTAAIPSYLQYKWKPIQRWVNDFAQGYLGVERGQRVMARVCGVANFFFKGAKRVAGVLTWPLWKTGEVLLNRYIRGLHESVQHETQRGIHHSLLFHLAEDLIGHLER